MPYIPQQEQDAIEEYGTLCHPGALNYAVTKLALEYIFQNGLRYQTINDVIGALEGAKAEFQRRVVAPYEDLKIAANGDLFLGLLVTHGLWPMEEEETQDELQSTRDHHRQPDPGA